jgi:nucleoside phosphorylase
VPERPSKTVVIVTALAVETNAVLRQLGPWKEEIVKDTVFFRGTFEGWDVAVVEVGSGNVSAAVLSGQAISYYNADVALFVGIAGGIKDVVLGDVVVATKMYGYESGKETAKGLKPRPELQRSALKLEQRARAMRQRAEWQKRLDPKIARQAKSTLHVGPIAAGEKVVASTRSATAKLIKQLYSGPGSGPHRSG